MEMYCFEAIRLGALAHKQSGKWTVDKRRKYGFFGPKVVYATCAIGAASVAMGVDHLTEAPEEVFEDTLRRFWPILEKKVICPVCVLNDTIFEIISVHLGAAPYEQTQQFKYGHGWTREAIADWLEPIERASTKQPKTSAVGVIEAP